MKVEIFLDEERIHYSYAILSECASKIFLIDPGIDIYPYLEFAKDNEAAILGIIQTSPYAHFTVSHLQLQALTGAAIYCSQIAAITDSYKSFQDGESIEFGKIKLKSLNVGAYLAGSIVVILEHKGIDAVIFTGLADICLLDQIFSLPKGAIVYPLHR